MCTFTAGLPSIERQFCLDTLVPHMLLNYLLIIISVGIISCRW